MIQELPCSTYEWASQPVFVRSWALSAKNNTASSDTLAKDNPFGLLTKPTSLALLDKML